MKIHAVLTEDAQRVLRGQDAERLDPSGQALIGRLNSAGLHDINMKRAVRHGIVTGDVGDRALASVRALPEVSTVEVDGTMRAI